MNLSFVHGTTHEFSTLEIFHADKNELHTKHSECMQNLQATLQVSAFSSQCSVHSSSLFRETCYTIHSKLPQSFSFLTTFV